MKFSIGRMKGKREKDLSLGYSGRKQISTILTSTLHSEKDRRIK
jgi:hypothetical protein